MTTNETDEDAGARRGPRGKIVRLIDEYDLDGVGKDLERRWLGDGRERESLRSLADHFNRTLLDARLTAADGPRPSQSVETLYEDLTDDDVSQGVRIERRRELERVGVDPDDLTSDFVSHQAVHTYLTKHRGVTREPEGDPLENAAATLNRLTGRTDAVADSTLERLRDTGRLDLAEYDVLVSVRVVCNECGQAYDAVELIERGGCDCQE